MTPPSTKLEKKAAKSIRDELGWTYTRALQFVKRSKDESVTLLEMRGEKVTCKAIVEELTSLAKE